MTKIVPMIITDQLDSTLISPVSVLIFKNKHHILNSEILNQIQTQLQILHFIIFKYCFIN